MVKNASIFKFVLLLCICTMLAASVFGCNNKSVSECPQVFFDHVRFNSFSYESTNSKRFGVNVCVITDRNDAEIEYIGASGENVDTVKCTVVDDTFDSVKTLKEKGMYLHIIGLSFAPSNTSVQINTITLKVDGHEAEYALNEPIRFEIVSDDDPAVSFPVYGIAVPSLITETSICDNDETVTPQNNLYQFGYTAEVDAVITDFGFTQYLHPLNTTVYVNDRSMGSAEDCFPLTVHENDIIKIKCNIAYNRDITDNDYGYTYCDTYISGHLPDSDDILSARMHLSCQGICNAENAADFLGMNVN